MTQLLWLLIGLLCLPLTVLWLAVALFISAVLDARERMEAGE